MAQCLTCHYLHRRQKEGSKANTLYFFKGLIPISLCTMCDLSFFQNGQYDLLEKLVGILDAEANNNVDAMVLRNKILRMAPQSLRAKFGKPLPPEEKKSDFERILEMDWKLGIR